MGKSDAIVALRFKTQVIQPLVARMTQIETTLAGVRDTVRTIRETNARTRAVLLSMNVPKSGVIH